MKLLLVSERMNCSPQMMEMLQNDLIHTVKKYFLIEEDKIMIQITNEPLALNTKIPLLGKKDR